VRAGVTRGSRRMVNMPTAIEPDPESFDGLSAGAVQTAPAASVATATAIETVAVLGLGYVGLPTGIALAAAGFEVIGVDVSERRLEDIREGTADLLADDRERLAAAITSERFKLTCGPEALAEADAVLICVPTPVDEERRPAPGSLASACRSVVENARPGQLIILMSTTYVGTTKDLLAAPLLRRGLVPGIDVNVAFSPERIDPGNTTWRQEAVPRVVGGVTPECTHAARGLIEKVAACVHPVSSPEAAELSKLYENSFRAVNIAFANEMAEACVRLRLDPLEVIEAAGTKPYGFMKFYPGPGVGGHCIPCDPHYLLWGLREAQATAPVLERAMEGIAARPGEVVARAVELLEDHDIDVACARVLLVGVAYKPGILDTRESPALQMLADLTRRGASVAYHDPLVQTLPLADGQALLSVSEPATDDFDLAIVVTTHPGHDYSWLEHFEVVDYTYRAIARTPI
jgi:UDP-N-acetyl-D-glucosamine dehydrogenase